MNDQISTPQFSVMADGVSEQIGFGRYQTIIWLIKNVQEGYCQDIDRTISTIMAAMKDCRAIVLNPENNDDWEKIGVPGGPKALRALHQKTPRKPPPETSTLGIGI